MRKRQLEAQEIMRKTSAELVSFVKNPAGRAVLLLATLLSVGAALLGALQASYVHPGPAVALGGLAVVVLLVGWVIQDLWEAHYGTPTRVLGLEFLFNRWIGFKPTERDSEILYAHISIALSIAELEYGHLPDIRFVKAFSGVKMQRGIFLLQPGGYTPIVLKFDEVGSIKQECERYAAFAKLLGMTPGQPWVPKQRHVTMAGEDWGAIGYNLVGARGNDLISVQTLGEYYLRHDSPQRIEKVLEITFAALQPWWATPETGPEDLYQEYDRLTSKLGRIEEGTAQAGQALQLGALANINAHQTYVNLGSDLVLRNPLNWVRDIFGQEQLGQWVTDRRLRRDSVVHGDLHAGNVLIDENEFGVVKAWVIDLPHSHYGPTVQDIARLEADIKFGLLPDDTLQGLSIHEICDFEASLLAKPDRPTPSIAILAPSQDEPADKQLRKMWKAVCLLRKEARNYLSGDDARPYYLALLHATLPTSYYHDRTPWQKLYAFISAALLCERLEG